MKPEQFDNPTSPDQGFTNRSEAKRLPGLARLETQFWLPRLDKNGKEKGVVDPQGNFIKLEADESFVVNKGEGADYEAVAVGKNGERRILRPFKTAKKVVRQQQDDAEIQQVRQQLATPETSVDRDTQYAEKYWQLRAEHGDKPKLIEGIKQSFRQSILDAANSDEKRLAIFVAAENFSEEERAKISAYRVLAKELGYEIGPYKISKGSGTAMAEIKKL
jgi:hypothetical protein